LESESIMAGGIAPRNIIFNKPFLIMLKRHEAKSPYFALWVANAEILVSRSREKKPTPTLPERSEKPVAEQRGNKATMGK
jgi:hypothetical protein